MWLSTSISMLLAARVLDRRGADNRQKLFQRQPVKMDKAVNFGDVRSLPADLAHAQPMRFSFR